MDEGSGKIIKAKVGGLNDGFVEVAELIWDSKPVKGVKCNKSSLSATALKSGDSYIILLSDYTKKPSFGTITISLPKTPVGKVWDLARKKQGGKIVGNKVIINNFQPIEKNTQTALYYIGKDTPKWSGK